MSERNKAARARVAKLLAGKRQSAVSVKVKLYGRAGELWITLLGKAGKIGLEPQDVFALLLEEGWAKVCGAIDAAAVDNK